MEVSCVQAVAANIFSLNLKQKKILILNFRWSLERKKNTIYFSKIHNEFESVFKILTASDVHVEREKHFDRGVDKRSNNRFQSPYISRDFTNPDIWRKPGLFNVMTNSNWNELTTLLCATESNGIVRFEKHNIQSKANNLIIYCVKFSISVIHGTLKAVLWS